jgi:hypothetical protein
MPMLFFVWALIHKIQTPSENMSLTVLMLAIGVMVFGWLLARFYYLCSIELSADGISQSYALLHKNLGVSVGMRWDQVQSVSFSGLSYFFCGKDGTKMELNTSLIGNVGGTINIVRELLPNNLLIQLGDQSKQSETDHEQF